MTSHELAKKLLELPDLPVATDNSDYGVGEIKTIVQDTGYYKAETDCLRPVCNWSEDPCIMLI